LRISTVWNADSLKATYPGLSFKSEENLTHKINNLLHQSSENGVSIAERQRDHNALRDLLIKAAAEEGMSVTDERSTGVVASCDKTRGLNSKVDNSKFDQPRQLTYGLAKDATLGLPHFMCVDIKELGLGMHKGIKAMEEQMDKYGSAVDKECLHYILYEEAGSSDVTFQNGWKVHNSLKSALYFFFIVHLQVSSLLRILTSATVVKTRGIASKNEKLWMPVCLGARGV